MTFNEYIGMNFYDWCKLDSKDDRKINYKFYDTEDKCRIFSSDDTVELSMITRLRNSTIIHVYLKRNEWYVTLAEDQEDEEYGEDLDEG